MKYAVERHIRGDVWFELVDFPTAEAAVDQARVSRGMVNGVQFRAVAVAEDGTRAILPDTVEAKEGDPQTPAEGLARLGIFTP